MNRLKNKRSVFLGMGITLLTVVVLFFAFCRFKEVYWFGPNVFSYGDADAQLVPMYYHVWDWLHGTKSLFFDWHTGLGNNTIGVVNNYGLLSPLNLVVLLLSPRDDIMFNFSYILLLKYIFIALSCFYVLQEKVNKNGLLINILLSILYCYNGFTMQYFIIPEWLDVAGLFPLMMMAVINLFDENKQGWLYSMTFASIAVLCINLTWMIVLFLIIFSFCYICFIVSKDNRGVATTRFILYSIIGIMISSFILLPGAYQVLNSYRLNSSMIADFIDGYNTILYNDWMKWGMTIGGAGSLFLGLIGLAYLKKSNDTKAKELSVWLFVLTLLLIPIVIEGSDVVWQMGSYASFPMRFGFMIQFISIYCVALLYDQFKDLKIEMRNLWEKSKFQIVGLSIVLLIAILLIYARRYSETFQASASLIITFLLVCLGTMLIVIVFKFKKSSLIIVTLIMLVFSLSYAKVIATCRISDESNSTTMLAYSFKDYLPAGDLFDRVKKGDGFAQNNYTLILQKSAISNYYHVNSKKQVQFYINLGLNQKWTRVGDEGGTVVSDSIIRYKTIVTKDPAVVNQYQKTGQAGDYAVYNSSFVAPLGIPVSSSILDTQFTENYLSNQLLLDKQVLKDESLKVIPFVDDVDLTIDEPSIVYVSCSDCGDFSANYNGGSIFNSIGNMDSNGIINLGIYDASFNLSVTTDVTNHHAEVGIVEIAQFQKTIDSLEDNMKSYVFSNTGVSLQYDNKTNDELLLLPISSIDGWKCTNNGKSVDILSAYGGFMVLPIENGINSIDLHYTSPYLYGGCIVSLIGIFLLVVYNWKWKDYQFSIMISKTSLIIETIAFGGVILIAYILPIVFFLLNLIMRYNI